MIISLLKAGYRMVIAYCRL